MRSNRIVTFSTALRTVIAGWFAFMTVDLLYRLLTHPPSCDDYLLVHVVITFGHLFGRLLLRSSSTWRGWCEMGSISYHLRSLFLTFVFTIVYYFSFASPMEGDIRYSIKFTVQFERWDKIVYDSNIVLYNGILLFFAFQLFLAKLIYSLMLVARNNLSCTRNL